MRPSKAGACTEGLNLGHIDLELRSIRVDPHWSHCAGMSVGGEAVVGEGYSAGLDAEMADRPTLPGIEGLSSVLLSEV